MENRIDRKNDESLYQPKVHSDRVRELYNLKQITGMPMTVLLDQAIRDLTASYGVSSRLGEEPVFEKVDQETWEEICEYRKFLDQLEYQRCLDELAEVMSKEKEILATMGEQEPMNERKEVSQIIYQAK